MFDNYNKLLKQSVDLSDVKDDGERKRRRKNPPNNSVGEEITNDNSVIEILDSSSEEDDFDSDEFEDVDINAQPADESDVVNESEDFHSVGFTDQDFEDAHNAKDDVITIKLNNSTEEVKVNKKKHLIISKEERHKRIMIHKFCVVSMLIHGQYRNSWCNNRDLQKVLSKVVSKEIRLLLEPKVNDSQTNLTKSRKFLDGLRKLMYMYSSKLRITHQGLLYKDWGELGKYQPRKLKDVSLTKFKELIKSHRGSRDIAAQGFVSLLRALKLNARLVFSLQPPDFTSISVAREPGEQDRNKISTPSTHAKKESNFTKLLSSKSKILQSTRFGKQSNPKEEDTTFIDSEYPVFWAEVWDKYSKKWISIDAVSLKTIEQVPMRRRSKFQPALNDPRNQLTYVIAYDKFGGVRDVTRRYAQFFNAKTSRKRIDYRNQEDKTWYNTVLRSLNKLNRRDSSNMIDALEAKEFHDRDLCEGMPNNMTDFHNHPIYALKSQLKQNEVVFPDNDTSVCGYFRPKTSGKSNKGQSVIPVIKRSNIYSLKSARAWYMRGRVIKPGEQPLRVKSRSKKEESDILDYDTEDQDVRLYADFQTKLYIPPPIEGGKVPKNAYGNIDIYTPSMIPENGYLIQSSDFSMKVAEYAAKLIGIDYAKAIVSFQFGKARKSFSHSAKPTEGGIVIDSQFKDALVEVMESIKEEEQEYERLQLKLQSLKLWKFFLTNLRISRRLDSTHGLIEDTATTNAKDAYVKNQRESHSITQNSGKYAKDIIEVPDEVGSKSSEYSEWASSDNERGNGAYPGVKGQSSDAASAHDVANESETSDSDVDMAGGFFAEDEPDPEEPAFAPSETLHSETESHNESSKSPDYEEIQEEVNVDDYPPVHKDSASDSDTSSRKAYSSDERAAATSKVPEKKFDQSNHETVNRTDADISSLSEASGPPSGESDHVGSYESFEFQYSDSE
ncbi:Piso0_002583 [Millerozyma farinosa CBS 7064]|uniref:Piso0_002583 protein n=1 Tax=Pichia sorbitophila (strain ATCC MYA-4447 / BCRC 22081 / CBS 7064 / NBRC 10061 / NRRL Y-12695) TaxID=559304 RepID=G8YFF5_PICSO|nr:Piso0_002583 [Millerozyma farinosa CBS 7064]